MPTPFVDVDDIADVVAAPHSRRPHVGRSTRSPAPLADCADAAAIIAAATGRPVARAGHARTARGRAARARVRNEVVELLTYVLRGRRTSASRDDRRGAEALGREPRDFAAYAARPRRRRPGRSPPSAEHMKRRGRDSNLGTGYGTTVFETGPSDRNADGQLGRDPGECEGGISAAAASEYPRGVARNASVLRGAPSRRQCVRVARESDRGGPVMVRRRVPLQQRRDFGLTPAA